MQILIGWELGGNYGHILGLLPILKTLRQRSHDILLVVRDISIAEETLHNTGCSFIQAPIPRRKAPLNRDIANYGDILAFHGFAERDVLFSLVHAWQHLYRLYRPDVVVINHAPAALFSVRLSDIPTVEIGTGFELLPRSIPYPCFRPWLDLPDAALAQTEEIILTSLNTLRNAHQKTPHAALCDSLCADTRLLMTFSEIDHYPNRENTEYIGPLFTFIIKSRPMKIKLLATICVVLLFFGIASGAHAEMETFNFEWSGESFGNTAVATGNITMDAAVPVADTSQHD